MVNVKNDDLRGLVLNVVQDAIGTAPRGVGAAKFALERLPDATRGGGEVTEDECDDRRNDSRGNAVQVAAGCRREDDVETHPLGTLARAENVFGLANDGSAHETE
jgi:hypothetical protein